MVRAAVDVTRLLVTAVTSEQRAVLRAAIPHLHVIVGTAVVELDLESERQPELFI